MNEIVLNQWLDEDNGNTGIFTTDIGADSRPLMEMIVDIEGYQTGSGDPSPENIRPIVSYDGGQISVSGGNIFNYNDRASTDNYYLDSTGTPVPATKYYTSNFIRVKPSTYYFYAINGVPEKIHADHNSPRIAYYTEQKEYISSGDAIGYGNSFLTPQNCAYIKVPVYTNYDAHLAAMVTEGTTAPTTYSAFVSTTYLIAFPVSVYKGKLDLWSGVLMVEKRVVDLGDLTWIKNVTNQYYSNALDPDGVNAKSGSTIICSAYKSGNAYDRISDKTICYNGRVWIYDTDLNGTGTEVKEIITGYKCAYELATPTTYQLTPQQINTLLKDNVIYTTFGKIKRVTYPCDKNLYVEKNFLS